MFLLLLQDHNRNVHTIQTSHATTITYMYIIITATLLTRGFLPVNMLCLSTHSLRSLRSCSLLGLLAVPQYFVEKRSWLQDGQPCCCWTADTQRRAKLGSKVYTHKASAKSSFLPSLQSKTSLHVIKGKHWPSYIIHDKQICVGQDIERILVK